MAGAGGINVGAGFIDIALKFPDLGSAMKGVGAGLSSAGRGVGKGIGDALRGSAPAIKSVGVALGQSSRGFGAGLGSAIKSTSAPINAMGTGLGAASRGVGKGLGDALRGSAPAVKSLGIGLGSASRGFGSGLTQSIRSTASPIGAMGHLLGRTSSGFGTGLGRALHGVSGVIDSVISKPIQALTGGLGSLKGLLAIGGGIGAGIGLKEIAGQAMGMETAMVKLSRVTDMPMGGKGIKGLVSSLKEMATTLPGVPVEQLFKTATFAAKLGIEGPALELFTRDVSKMSLVLDEIPIDEAVTRMARLLNLFHRAPTDALGIASALNRLDIASTASARDILDMSTRMGGLASTMKLSLPQVMALATTMREAGIEVGVGGTAMSQLLGKMAGKGGAGFAKIAKIDPKMFQMMLANSPFEALKAFFAALQKMTPQQAVKALESINFTGQRTRGTFLQLTQTFAKLADYERMADKEFASGESIQKGFAAQAGTTTNQLELLWNSLKLAAIEIGQHFLPVVKGFAKGMGELFEDVRSWLESNNKMFAAWGKSVGDFMKGLGTLKDTWQDHLKIIREVAAEKGEQLLEIFHRLGKPMMDIFSWLADSAAAAMSSSLGKSARKLGVDIVSGIAVGMASAAEAVPGGMALTQMALGVNADVLREELMRDAIRQKKKIDAEEFKAPKFPVIDFKGIIKDLPNRGAQILDIQKNINKKVEAEAKRHADQMRNIENRDRQARQAEALRGQDIEANRLRVGGFAGGGRPGRRPARPPVDLAEAIRKREAQESVEREAFRNRPRRFDEPQKTQRQGDLAIAVEESKQADRAKQDAAMAQARAFDEAVKEREAMKRRAAGIPERGAAAKAGDQAMGGKDPTDLLSQIAKTLLDIKTGGIPAEFA